MKQKRSVIAMVLALLFILSASVVFAGVNFSVSANVNVPQVQITGYYSALEQYNNIPDRDVMFIKKRGVSDEELPVVLFIASKSNVSTDMILKMRSRKLSWWQIAMSLNLDPELFYFPVKAKYRGKIYGNYYNNFSRPRNDWKRIVMNDDDMINSVNMKFVADHYGYDTDYVIRMREEGRNFIAINDQLRMNREKEHNNNWRARDVRGNDWGWNESRKYDKSGHPIHIENKTDRRDDRKDYKADKRDDRKDYRDDRRDDRKDYKADKRDDRKDYRDDNKHDNKVVETPAADNNNAHMNNNHGNQDNHDRTNH
jgi:hypothetical protein